MSSTPLNRLLQFCKASLNEGHIHAIADAQSGIREPVVNEITRALSALPPTIRLSGSSQDAILHFLFDSGRPVVPAQLLLCGCLLLEDAMANPAHTTATQTSTALPRIVDAACSIGIDAIVLTREWLLDYVHRRHTDAQSFICKSYLLLAISVLAMRLAACDLHTFLQAITRELASASALFEEDVTFFSLDPYLNNEQQWSAQWREAMRDMRARLDEVASVVSSQRTDGA